MEEQVFADQTVALVNVAGQERGAG
jgi:hypothetical protein